MGKMATSLLALGLFLGCYTEPKKSAQPAETGKPAGTPKATELETGRVALQKLYVAARSWGMDARPVRLQSQPAADASGRDGKSAIWRATFASPSRRGLKPYTWSQSAAPDAPERGIQPGPEDTFNPSNTSTQPFDIAFVKSDSDKAFSVAQQHGGEKILKTNKDLPVIYVLEWEPRENRALWQVLYGSAGEPRLRVTVNASTAEFIRAEK